MLKVNRTLKNIGVNLCWKQDFNILLLPSHQHQRFYQYRSHRLLHILRESKSQRIKLGCIPSISRINRENCGFSTKTTPPVSRPKFHQNIDKEGKLESKDTQRDAATISSDYDDTSISLKYPRTNSFSQEEQQYLANKLGISNFDIINNANVPFHSSDQYLGQRKNAKDAEKSLNSNMLRKTSKQKTPRRKRVVASASNNSTDQVVDMYNNPIEGQIQDSRSENKFTQVRIVNKKESVEKETGWGIKTRIRVKSIHAARTIDIVSIISKVFGNESSGIALPKPLRYRFGKSSVIIQLPPIPSNSSSSSTNSSTAAATMKKETESSLGNDTQEENWMQSHRDHLKDVDTIRVEDIVVSSKKKSRHDHNQEFSSPPGSSNLYNVSDKMMPLDEDRMRYIVAFRFGSVVFFNVAPTEAQRILEQIKKHSVDPVANGFEQKEHFEVAICPGLNTSYYQHPQQHQHSSIQDRTGTIPNQPQPLPPLVNADYATVQQLDMNNVAVISTIMAQTVAMDSYNVTVDELLATFAKINATVKSEGKFTDMERETLLRVVAMNNSIFIDMVSKLGVMDRSDTAWNFSQYETVFEEMKNEFEIYNRFENIEFKLNLIQENAKFFLEVLQGHKSNSLEWCIIVLIAFECVLMCLDMSGLGTEWFSSFSMIDPSNAPIDSNVSSVATSNMVETAPSPTSKAK